MKRMREKLTYANVVATLALFIAVGGASAFAASQLAKNSVGTKQIKKGAVTGAKVKKHTLTGKNINLGKLGSVPSANTAAALTPLEALHVVGTPGQPAFLDGTVNYPPEKGVTFRSVSFFKDHEGIVHLEGFAKVGTGKDPIEGLLFSLPAGYRPAAGSTLIFPNVEDYESISVLGANVTQEGKDLSGAVYASDGEEALANLNGITFRAEG